MEQPIDTIERALADGMARAVDDWSGNVPAHIVDLYTEAFRLARGEDSRNRVFRWEMRYRQACAVIQSLKGRIERLEG